ncbi:MAG: hypothetical protein GWQ05_24510 [Verrucomicrobiaceae bacterium]|nr:hypothetical protein [Verrucomicrobiaceae bacterium]NCF94095.1 hypothetical protein [Verrucomicrobiaceae bacterium]
MISDDELRQKEAEVEALFGGGSPWAEEAPPEGAEKRIANIMNRVKLESLAKDSASFIFKSFGITLSGIAQALFKALPGSPAQGSDEASQDHSPED